MSPSVSEPVMPKSTRPSRPSAEHEDVRRVRVAVEVAVAEDHLEPRLGDQDREPAALVHRRRGEVEVGELDPLQPLERQHPAAGVGAVDLGDDDARVGGEVLAEDLGGAGLDPVVELAADRPGELVDDRDRVDEVEPVDAALDDARDLIEQRQVALDLAGRTRALHLDGDEAAAGKLGEVHLADRGRRDRHRVERREELVDRRPQVLLDHPLDIGVRERRDRVLELAELDEDLGRHDVGTGREELAELHERRAELVEHLAEVPAEGRQVLVVDHRRAAQRPALEHEPEAVPRRHLRDLAQPSHRLAPLRQAGHEGNGTRTTGVWPPTG